MLKEMLVPVVTGTIELLQLMLLRGRNYFPSCEDQAKTCINVLFAWASFQKLYLSLLKKTFLLLLFFFLLRVASRGTNTQ